MEMVRARTSNEVSPTELSAIEKFQAEHPELDTPENGKRIFDYVMDQWKVEFSDESLETALRQLRGQLTILPAARVEFNRAWSVYPQSQQEKFWQWFKQQNILVHDDSDEAFHNAAILVTELRGRDVTPETTEQAITRAAAHGKTLYYLPSSRLIAGQGQVKYPPLPPNITAEYITKADAKTIRELKNKYGWENLNKVLNGLNRNAYRGGVMFDGQHKNPDGSRSF